MRYHNITKDDMLNGDGLRAVLWTAGCIHNCTECHNPGTHDPNGGIPFDEAAKEELFSYLEADYIDGITFSGGDPLHKNNVEQVYDLIFEIREKFPDKTIYLYSGFVYEDIRRFGGYQNESSKHIASVRREIIDNIDVFIDGPFIPILKDVKYPHAGSINQRVIDIKATKECGRVVNRNEDYVINWLNKMSEANTDESIKALNTFHAYCFNRVLMNTEKLFEGIDLHRVNYEFSFET